MVPNQLSRRRIMESWGQPGWQDADNRVGNAGTIHWQDNEPWIGAKPAQDLKKERNPRGIELEVKAAATSAGLATIELAVRIVLGSVWIPQTPQVGVGGHSQFGADNGTQVAVGWNPHIIADRYGQVIQLFDFFWLKDIDTPPSPEDSGKQFLSLASQNIYSIVSRTYWLCNAPGPHPHPQTHSPWQWFSLLLRSSIYGSQLLCFVPKKIGEWAWPGGSIVINNSLSTRSHIVYLGP